MVRVVPEGRGLIYLPKRTSSQPKGVFIRGLSEYDVGHNIYSASYSLYYEVQTQNGTQQYFESYIAFTAYPMSLFVETTGVAYTSFNTEVVIDGKYYSIISPFLVEYDGKNINTVVIPSKINTNYEYLVRFGDDVLFLLVTPYGVAVYSVNRNAFYRITIPGKYLSRIDGIAVTMIGNTVFASAFYIENNMVNVVMLKAEFSYSDTVFSLVYSTQLVPPTQQNLGVAIDVVGNINYVVTVIRAGSSSPITNIGGASVELVSEIYYIVYNVATGSVNVVDSGVLKYRSIATGFPTFPTTPAIYGTKVTSIYGYYVFTLLYNNSVNSLEVYSFDINTMRIASTTIPNTNNNEMPYESFLQGNRVIIVSTQANNDVVQQGNIYYLPLDYYSYVIEDDGMTEVDVTEVVLSKNELVVAGKVKYVVDGSPCSGCRVEVYNAQSILGHQNGVQQRPIAYAITDNDGNFKIVKTLSNAPQDIDIVIVVMS